MDDETRIEYYRRQLRSMHRLPPRTALPSPLTEEERILLGELLQLPDTVSADAWLAHERSDAVALIALRKIVQQLRQDILGVQRTRWEGWDLSPVAALRLGGLADLPLDASPLVEAASNFALSRDELRRTLRQLRSLRRSEDDGSLAPADTDPAQQEHWLLSDLLHLADEVDPIYWLQQQRPVAAARIALALILEQSRPMQTLMVGTRIERRQLRHRLRVLTSAAGAYATLREITFGRGGFSLAASLWLRNWDRASAQQSRERMLTWFGFDRVTDDLGNEYLFKHHEVETLLLFGWSREHITMAYYPAVAAGARTLTFASLPFTVAVEGRRGKPFLLPRLTMGNLVWQTKAPASGQTPRG